MHTAAVVKKPCPTACDRAMCVGAEYYPELQDLFSASNLVEHFFPH
jgi:hypothetical protein